MTMTKTNHRKAVATNVFAATEAAGFEATALSPDPTNPYAFVVTVTAADGSVHKFRVLVKELG